MTQPEASANLREPAPRVIRVAALALLDDAHEAAKRFEAGGGEDPAALHKFRVTVRRLRSWLRLWRASLADSVSRKDERRIRRIARATGAARDIDVHLAWLAEERRGGSARQSSDITKLMHDLETERPAAVGEAIDAARDLNARHERFARRLERYCVHVRAPIATEERFGVALARVVRAASDSLEACLAAVRGRDDHDASHDARIAAKHLRYLLESAPGRMRARATLVRALEQLQDVVGEEHDSHVFARQLESRGARAGPRAGTLMRHLDERATQAYTRFEREWLDGAAATFFADVHRLADTLARGAPGRARARPVGNTVT